MAKQYYYFIAGLPGVSMEDSKLMMDPQQFREQAIEQLTSTDYQLLLSMHLLSDMSNLLDQLYNTERDPDPEGLYPKEFWDEYLSYLRQKIENNSLKTPEQFRALPTFLEKSLIPIISLDELPSKAETEHQLLSAFFDFSKDHSNKFFREYFELERNIKNILAAINGRNHKVEFAKYLIGNDDTVTNLAKSHAADFGLGKDHPLFDQLMRIWEQNDILYRERAYDVLRNKWIDEQNFFEYFNINRILGYYTKIRIIYRWQKADAALGKEIFHDTLNKLENSFTFPEDFNIRIKQK
jgi:hypothetical protein